MITITNAERIEILRRAAESEESCAKRARVLAEAYGQAGRKTIPSPFADDYSRASTDAREHGRRAAALRAELARLIALGEEADHV